MATTVPIVVPTVAEAAAAFLDTTSLRTLGRYVNPGPELAARVTAETDPARHRRG